MLQSIHIMINFCYITRFEHDNITNRNRLLPEDLLRLERGRSRYDAQVWPRV